MTIQAPSSTGNIQDVPETNLETQSPTETQLGKAPLENAISQEQDIAKANSPQVSIDSESQLGRDVAQVKAEEKKTIGDAIPTINKYSPVAMMAGISASMIEDIYNSSADLVNFVSKKGWDRELLPNIDIVDKYLPSDTVSVATREIGKFLVGYAGIFKAIGGANTLIKTAGAGALTDFIFTDPDAETLLSTGISKLPFGPEVIDYINSNPENQLNAEKRLRNSVAGIVEGVLLDKFIDGIKLIAKIKNAKRLGTIAKDLESGTKGGAEATAKAPKANVEDIPPITTRESLPPIPEEDYLDETLLSPAIEKRAEGIAARSEVGIQANPNEAMVGNKKYLNLTKLNSTDDLRKLISDEIVTNPEVYFTPVNTIDDIIAMSKKVGIDDIEDLINLPKERYSEIGTLVAAKSVMLKATDSFLHHINKFNSGDIPKELLAKAYANWSSAIKKVKDINYARGLGLFEGNVPIELANKSAKDSAEYYKQLMEAYKYFGENAEMLAEYIKKNPLTKRSDIMKAASSIKTSPVSILTNLRINGLLSGPTTHARNILSNFSNIGVNVGENLTAAFLNKTAFGNNTFGVAFTDVYHQAIGVFEGFSEALQITGKKIAGKNAAFMAEGAPGKIASIDTVIEPKDFLSRSLNYLISLPGRALLFEDNFIKHINARMSINEQASRQARILAETEGVDFVETYKKLKNNPTTNMLDIAYNESAYNTFTNKVSGQYIDSIKKFGETPLGKLIVPFMNTNLAAINYRLERVPGFNLFLNKYRSELMSSNPLIRQKAISKSLFSGATMSSLAFYLHSQDIITGNRKIDYGRGRVLDVAGRPQNSIKIGDTWIEYKRETPIGSILGMFADIADLIDVDDNRNPDLAQNLSTAAVIIASETFNPEFFTDSISDLITALKEGNVEGARNLINYTANIGTSFAPYSGFARALSKQFKTNQAETFNPNSVWETLVAQIKSIYLPEEFSVPKRDILGTPIPVKAGLGPDFISPIGYVEESKDPVYKELARLSGAGDEFSLKNIETISDSEVSTTLGYLNLNMPSKSLRYNKFATGREVRLNLKQYEELIRFSSGTHENFKGPSLKDTLANLFKNNKYKNLPNSNKIMITHKVITAYQRIGREMFLAKDNAYLLKGLIKSLIYEINGIESEL